ncbi:MAG: hypothetical protein K2I83_01380, partial [Bacteroidales bacterium]|nr:hypothetical protein [Bacteroidales bacterium]
LPGVGSNVADFLTLTVLSIYDLNVVKGNLNCQFRQTEEKKVESNPRSDCDISFGMPNSETCIGVPKTLMISGGSGGNNIEVTNITIDDIGSLAIKVDPFQSVSNGGKLTFYPYYAGAPDVATKTDTITATATYKMSGSAQELQWTKQFEVKVKACVPELSAYSFDCATCLRCPGTEGRVTVVFQNPTTSEDISRVDWRSEPATKASTPTWSYPKGVPTYRISARYYTDTKLEHISVVYNEGDSVYALKLAQLKNNGTINFQDFKVDSDCALRVKPDHDTCCLKDEIEADIINGNSKTVGKNTYYSQFQQLIWDPSVIQYVAESSRNLTAEQNLQGGNKGYRVRVTAYEAGVYPFRVVAQVGDTVLTYADTLRLSVFGRPRAFIQDTVYACLEQNLDLRKYVDNTTVKKIGSSVPSDLQHYVPNTEDPQTIYAYQIEMS